MALDTRKSQSLNIVATLNQLENPFKGLSLTENSTICTTSTNATFNIAYNSPTEVPANDFRIDLCVATDQPVGDNQYGIVSKTISDGRCAVLRHVGSDDTLGETVRLLCEEWFNQSGEIRRDFPLFFQRVKFPPEVSENDSIIDVYLPLQRR